MQLLVGDIGGTNARIAVAEVDDAGVVYIGRTVRHLSREHAGLVPIVESFLAGGPERPTHACFAIAGPVRHGEVDATNLPWRVRAVDVAAAIGVPDVLLINDFLANGFGVSRLGPDDAVTLQAGEPSIDGVGALLGAGTGLGAAIVVTRGPTVAVHPSEGGHASFAPQDELQDGLLAFLRAELGHVSTERVLSGPGLANVYRYLAARGVAPESDAVRRAMAAGDPAAAITNAASSDAPGGADPLATAAVELFVRIYGSTAGSLALTLLATRGVYVSGGIARHLLPWLRGGLFLEAFHSKGRMRPLLERVPLHVVTRRGLGLLGAAVAGWVAARERREV
jgi:glucokinase